MKMEIKVIRFDDTKTPKQKFLQHKRPISIKNVDIDKIVVSNKLAFGKKGFKYFIGYKDAKKNKPSSVFLTKMTAYRKDFNETRFISFLTKDSELLKKYNEIWENVTNIIYKEFDGNPVYNEKYIRTKIKSYNGKINTNFPDNNPPNIGLDEDVFKAS